MGRLRFKSTVKWCLVLVALSSIAALGVYLRSSSNSVTQNSVPHGGMAAILLPRQASSNATNRLELQEDSDGSLSEVNLVARVGKDAGMHTMELPLTMVDAADSLDHKFDPNIPIDFPLRSGFKLKQSWNNLMHKFPRIMIVGFGKAGTKALFDMLKMHPDIRGPVTERRFFSDHYEKGLRYYLKSLPEPTLGGFVVEKSPDYVTDDPVPARIIASANKLGVGVEKLKFVIVLRDPIDRAMSEYLEWQVARRNSGSKKLMPFHVMVVNHNGTINSEQPFLKNSNYARYIKHWYQFFNRTQTCFVDGDKFVKDPFSEVRLLESCLLLPSYFTPEHFVYESKRGFYCFKASLSQIDPYCMGSSKGRRHPPIPEVVVSALRKYYQPSDDQLQSLTNRTMQWLQTLSS